MKFPELVTIFELSGWQALGKFPNPATGKAEVTLAAARNAIDILILLREKCRGNLAGEEEKHLAAAIANLQLNYAAEQEKAAAAPEQQAAPEKGAETPGGAPPEEKQDDEGRAETPPSAAGEGKKPA